MRLNCDLGEGFDEIDRKVMPFIDQANIACGGHAGDIDSMQRTVALAEKRRVSIGAHPSYPDKENFGRVSIAYSPSQLQDALLEQVTSLEQVCREQGTSLDYIKAHGALYNDSVKDSELMHMLLKLAKSFQCQLMIQAHPKLGAFEQDANDMGVTLLKEGFADRAYTDEGLLVPRQQQGAVHSSLEQIVDQAQQLAETGTVVSINNKLLKLQIDSICVHGDSEHALEALQRIYDTLH